MLLHVVSDAYSAAKRSDRIGLFCLVVKQRQEACAKAPEWPALSLPARMHIVQFRVDGLFMCWALAAQAQSCSFFPASDKGCVGPLLTRELGFNVPFFKLLCAMPPCHKVELPGEGVLVGRAVLSLDSYPALPSGVHGNGVSSIIAIRGGAR